MRKFKAGLIVFFFFCLFKSFAFAQDVSSQDEKTRFYIVLPNPSEDEDPRAHTASSKRIESKTLRQVPQRRIGDLLTLTPGLIAIQHSGGGKANQYFLRGFDADHGTDIAFSLEGMLINQLSHGHGQGFADLNFLIPEILETLEARKGPYFVQDGDLATAGAIEFRLKEKLEHNQFTFETGSFNTFRSLILAGKENQKSRFYIANEIYTTDGPFVHPDRYLRYNLIFRGAFDLEKWKGSLITSSYHGFWNASNQIPATFVENGSLDRFDALDSTDGGSSQRHQILAKLTYAPSAKQKIDWMAYGAYYDLNLFSNFTFFLEDPLHGDQLNQKDKRFQAGFQTKYDREDYLGPVRLRHFLGAGLRFDRIKNALHHTQARALIEANTENLVSLLNPYFYLQEDIQPASWLRLSGGVRLDGLHMDVADRLAQGVEGQNTSWVLSPKAGVVLSPHSILDLFMNFGQGFHSNDARGVVRSIDPASPYAKATGGEAGIRLKPFQRLNLDVAAWYLDLESELVFSGDAGTTEPSGPTRRAGIEADLNYKILDWLTLDFDFTWTHARFRDLPEGENAVPLAPRWTLSGGLMAEHPLGIYGSLRTRAISDRPANEDASLTATGYYLLDLMLGDKQQNRKWFGSDKSGFALEFKILNFLDANYRESQFDTTSRPDSTGAELTDVHFTPGYPRTFLGSFTLYY